MLGAEFARAFHTFPHPILAYVRHSSCSHGSHRLINGLQREKCLLRDPYSSIEARARRYIVVKGASLPSTQILLKLYLDLSRNESKVPGNAAFANGIVGIRFLAPIPAPAPARLPPSALSGPAKCAF